MPFYPELSVEKVWPIIKKDSELIKYFPKYSLKHFPNRDYLYTVLSSIRPVEIKTLVKTILETDQFIKIKLVMNLLKCQKNGWMN